MFIYRFCTVYKQTNENNELKPITTVFIDHVLPKIDLDVLIGVENRRRFSESKIGVVFASCSESRFRFSSPCVFSLTAEIWLR